MPSIADMTRAADRRANELLPAIHAYVTAHGYSPSIADLAATLNVNRETVRDDLRVLEDAGLITTRPNQPRTISMTRYRVTLVPIGDDDDTTSPTT